MPNREYNAMYNDHEKDASVMGSVGSKKKAKYNEKKRSLGPAGNLRPPYESSAPKVKCSTNCNY